MRYCGIIRIRIQMDYEIINPLKHSMIVLAVSSTVTLYDVYIDYNRSRSKSSNIVFMSF